MLKAELAVLDSLHAAAPGPAPRRYIHRLEGPDRITIEPGKIGGQACVRGHRFTVEHLLSLVGAGWTLEQIQTDFPFIEAADIQQSSAYAALA